MLRIFLLSILVLFTPSIIQCELTNLNDFLNLLTKNPSTNYPIGYLSKANSDVVKRYLRGNVIDRYFDDRQAMLKAIDNETIIGM